jgi:hypothetical protein
MHRVYNPLCSGEDSGIVVRKELIGIANWREQMNEKGQLERLPGSETPWSDEGWKQYFKDKKAA